MPTIRVYIFHRAMRCGSCRAVHRAGEVTHTICWPNGIAIRICNHCHTAQWTWTFV